MSLPVMESPQVRLTAPRFRSAVDVTLVLLLLMPLLALPVLIGPELKAWIIFAVVAVLTSALVCPCYYQFEADHLLIRCGVLFRQQIPYQQIDDVVPGYSPVSGPALSFDRLMVRYNRHQFVCISPADRAGFLTELATRRSGANTAL